MNILNENEAIVINSLENWEKVAEILDSKGYSFPLNQSFLKWDSAEYQIPFYLRFIGDNFFVYGFLDRLPDMQLIAIQDTEFIAKHSKNIFQEQMEAFYSQPLKQDKNMKIVVKKENGLLEVGQTLKYTVFSETEKTIRLFDGNGDYATVFEWQFNKWLKNGYIEEVKEVSYRFADIYEGEGMNLSGVATNKQFDQVLAYMKLTHVRAKILKDHGYSEDWEPERGMYYYHVCYDTEELRLEVRKSIFRYALGLSVFPTRELAELALQHNQELFKTYLGV